MTVLVLIFLNPYDSVWSVIVWEGNTIVAWVTFYPPHRVLQWSGFYKSGWLFLLNLSCSCVGEPDDIPLIMILKDFKGLWGFIIYTMCCWFESYGIQLLMEFLSCYQYFLSCTDLKWFRKYDICAITINYKEIFCSFAGCNWEVYGLFHKYTTRCVCLLYTRKHYIGEISCTTGCCGICVLCFLRFGWLRIFPHLVYDPPCGGCIIWEIFDDQLYIDSWTWLEVYVLDLFGTRWID